MKQILSAVALLLALSLLAACGGAPAPASPAAPDPAPASASPEASTPAEPAVPEKLIIGLDDQFPPMGFRDDQNQLVGFDIDLAKAVCDKLGIEAVPPPSTGPPRKGS